MIGFTGLEASRAVEETRSRNTTGAYQLPAASPVLDSISSLQFHKPSYLILRLGFGVNLECARRRSDAVHLAPIREDGRVAALGLGLFLIVGSEGGCSAILLLILFVEIHFWVFGDESSCLSPLDRAYGPHKAGVIGFDRIFEAD